MDTVSKADAFSSLLPLHWESWSASVHYSRHSVRRQPLGSLRGVGVQKEELCTNTGRAGYITPGPLSSVLQMYCMFTYACSTRSWSDSWYIHSETPVPAHRCYCPQTKWRTRDRKCAHMVRDTRRLHFCHSSPHLLALRKSGIVEADVPAVRQ